MQKEKRVVFTQEWIEDAVKKLFHKEDIYESDMEQIKYLRIGDDNFGGDFVIEMSTATPPDPFYDNYGGDEWDEGADGATVSGRFIQLYIDYVKENPFDSIDSETGERFFQLTQFEFWHAYEEEYAASETEEDVEYWEDVKKKLGAFEKTILYEEYGESFDSDDAYEEWEQQVERGIEQDIVLFTGLEVLRTQGTEYQDMTFLKGMPRLRAWEAAELRFRSLAGLEDLVRLKQLCCWLD